MIKDLATEENINHIIGLMHNHELVRSVPDHLKSTVMGIVGTTIGVTLGHLNQEELRILEEQSKSTNALPGATHDSKDQWGP